MSTAQTTQAAAPIAGWGDLSKADRAAWLRENGKSYLSAEEREKLLRESGMNLVYLAESQDAGEAGDRAAAWQWLALAAVPAHSLKTLKESNGAGFIRKWGFDTSKADAAYGPDWLEQ